MNEASSDARKSAAAAISSGSATRPSGYQRERRSKMSGATSRRSRQMGVRTVPGQMALTRTPAGPNSTAAFCVSEISPAFAAL